MTYLVSDLHGKLSVEQFKKLLHNSGFTEADTLYVLGDTLDRGPHGVALLDWFSEQRNVIHLSGNHEHQLLDVGDLLLAPATMENKSKITPAFFNKLNFILSTGGYETLKALDALPISKARRLLEYIRAMPLYAEITVREKAFILCHGGIENFQAGKPMSEYSVDELLYNRPRPWEPRLGHATLVFGHTPYSTAGIFRGEGWICIDTSKAGSPTLLRLEDDAEFRYEWECE